MDKLIKFCEEKDFKSAKKEFHDSKLGNEAFVELCRRGCIHMVRYLASYVKEIDIHYGGGQPLFAAINGNSSEVLKFLIDMGVREDYKKNTKRAKTGYMIDVHLDNEKPMIEACRLGNLEVAKILYEQSKKEAEANIGRVINLSVRKSEVFRKAAASGHYEVVEWLLSIDEKKTIDIHAVMDEAFGHSCKNGHFRIAELILDIGIAEKNQGKKGTDTSFWAGYMFINACKKGDIKRIKFLLDMSIQNKLSEPVDIHANNEAAFRTAAAESHIDIMKFLYKASVNEEKGKKIDVYRCCDELLIEMCEKKNKEVVKLLIEYGADYIRNYHQFMLENDLITTIVIHRIDYMNAETGEINWDINEKMIDKILTRLS